MEHCVVLPLLWRELENPREPDHLLNSYLAPKGFDNSVESPASSVLLAVIFALLSNTLIQSTSLRIS